MRHSTALAPLSGDPRTAAPVATSRSLDARLALLWGCEPATAHAIRHRARSPLQRVCDEFDVRLQMHGEAAALAWLEPLMQRVHAVQAVDLRAADHQETLADLAEDLAQEQWRANPTRETARTLLAASAEHRYHAERRDAAVRAAIA